MSYKANYVTVEQTGGRFVVFTKQGDQGEKQLVAIRETRIVAERIRDGLAKLLSEHTEEAYKTELAAQELPDES